MATANENLMKRVINLPAPWLRPVAALAGLAVALAGCARRETPAAAGLRSQTLLVGNAAEPADLDPQTSNVLNDQIIQLALFEGLTVLDEQSTESVAAAADHWSVSPDGLVWTFHLRAGLKWSNGEPLAAGDFLASWRRVLSPAFAAEGAWYLFPVRNAEAYNAGRITDFASVGLAAPDDATLVITLERPAPYLPALVSMPAWFPINPRVLEKFGAMDRRGTAWTRPGSLVGNGPFVLKEWTPNSRIVVEKNPFHRDAAGTRLRQVIFFPIENPDVEEREFRAGQLHVTFNLPVAKIAAWRDRDPAHLRLDPVQQTNFLRFNTTKPPLADARVRRALSLAIDRDTLARTVLQGSRLPAHSLTPPGTGGYTARAGVPLDFAAARQLLAAAGFPGGRGLPEIELQCRNNELSPRLAEALQAIWLRELGVRITLAPLEQKTWVQNQQTLNYAITLAAWTGDYPDPLTFLGLFTSDSSYNWTGWKQPAYDRLLADAARALDPRQRFEVFQQAEQLLLDEAPVAPVHLGAQTYLIDPAVHGWVPAPLVFRRFQLIHLGD
jgi:oligopeptide transport system substrate-binding protein